MKRRKFQVMLLTAILVCSLCFGVVPKQNSITGSIVGFTAYAEEYDEEDESYDEEDGDWSDEGEDEDSENTSSADVELQVIQVMAKGKNPITGELYEMDKFVAGKSTVIRAQFSEERDIPQDGSLILTINKDGSELIELLPISGGEADSAVFAPRDIQDINSWEEGEYDFVLSEDGEEVSTRSAQFKEAKKIKVLVVPVLANYGGEVVGCEGEWMTGLQMTQDTYPLADNGIDVVLGEELDCSGDEFDLRTEKGMYALWESLANLQTKNNDYELVLGYVRNRQGENGNIQGYTLGLPANIITESDGDMMPTVAHEIAHCYYIGDEYDGGSLNPRVNPAPYGMEGKDWYDRSQMSKSSSEPVERTETHSGSLISLDQVPFNARTMQALSNVGSWMGSGSSNPDDYWVTSDIWNHLFSTYVYNDPNVQPYSEDDGDSGSGEDSSEDDEGGGEEDESDGDE